MTLQEIEQSFTSGLYHKRPITLVRGAGVRVWDSEGHEYIDCTSGIGVAALGHAHPVIVAAVQKQSELLITCHEMFYNNSRAELLGCLSRLLPEPLTKFFFSNSGAEANEAAIKFARATTGRSGIVSARRGYHGKTMGALSANWDRKNREPFEPLVPDFESLRFNDCTTAKEVITEHTAAVIIEVIQGEGGVRPASQEFLNTLRKACNDCGALLIIDEVQTGFGRTGRMFAFEHYEVIPDILTLAKAAGGGLPIGITAFHNKIDNLAKLSHTTTFGGNPLVCAVATAVIEHLVRENIPKRAADRGAYFIDQLRAIDHPEIREVRGQGLMIGVELKHPAGSFARNMMNEGVLALLAGNNILRFLPPLIIDTAEIDQVVSALRRVLN